MAMRMLMTIRRRVIASIETELAGMSLTEILIEIYTLSKAPTVSPEAKTPNLLQKLTCAMLCS